MTADKQKILIADDEPLFLRTTAALLTQAGFHCQVASDGAAALDALDRERFDLLLSDLSMPGNLQLELLEQGRNRWPQMPVIVITGAPTLPSAIASVRLGIADYLLKPAKYDDLLTAVRRALESSEAAADGEIDDVAADARPFGEVIGESDAMRSLFDVMARIVESDANVLITGESGTGKEVVARAIHRRSRRSDGPLQIVDCTAIPENLFESVLFGHAKGSFTGATADQTGLIAKADGGTAFFDEIGELTAPLQAKLLRVIQEQTFTPLGKTAAQKVDARFLCATNRDLGAEVEQGTFRRDLFYRLAVIHLELPPLRQRGDDVLLLADNFLKELQPSPPRITGFTEQCQEVLKQYHWPGNVRELRNAVERGIAMSRTELVDVGDLPPAVLMEETAGPAAAPAARGSEASRTAALAAADREFFERLLRKCQGNIAAAAREAGMSRQGLHKTLKRLGIEPDEYRR